MSGNTIAILDQSLLIPNKFQVVFNRIANTVFYCTRVAIPSISGGEAPRTTPFVDLYVPGDKLQFGTLDLTFVVDAKFSGWTDVYQWLVGINFPQNFQQYANLANTATRSVGFVQAQNTAGIRPPYSDAILNVYTSKNNPAQTFNFINCFPVTLGIVQFDYGMSADEVLTCDASFRFDYYTFNGM